MRGTFGARRVVRGDVKTMALKYSARAVVASAAVLLVACGAPLRSVGERSSRWINEPQVATTAAPSATLPTSVGSGLLRWWNDGIVAENLADRDALIADVFARREGDRFIQASRAEIAAALPDVQFPAEVPYGAEWVSSQLVIENSGELSTDPSAAFGIWSAEPYTRSRSVAQMAVLLVSVDAGSGAETAESAEEATCAQFADAATETCDVTAIGGRRVWNLLSAGGTTLIWFEGGYRYQLRGRSFLSREEMEKMAAESVLLAEVSPVGD